MCRILKFRITSKNIWQILLIILVHVLLTYKVYTSFHNKNLSTVIDELKINALKLVNCETEAEAVEEYAKMVAAEEAFLHKYPTGNRSATARQYLSSDLCNFDLEDTLPVWVTDISSNIRIDLTFPESNTTFTGFAQISFSVLQTCHRIVLNANELTIKRASINGIECVRIREYYKQLWLFYSKLLLYTNNSYTLDIEYVGKVNHGRHGIYRSQVNLYSNKTFFISNMEPNEIRRVFPCFDEPNVQGNFELSVSKPGLSGPITYHRNLTTIVVQNAFPIVDKHYFKDWNPRDVGFLSHYFNETLILQSELNRKLTYKLYTSSTLRESDLSIYVIAMVKQLYTYYKMFDPTDDYGSLDIYAVDDIARTVTGLTTVTNFLESTETNMNTNHLKFDIAVQLSKAITRIQLQKVFQSYEFEDVWIFEGLVEHLSKVALQHIYRNICSECDELFIIDILNNMASDAYDKIVIHNNVIPRRLLLHKVSKAKAVGIIRMVFNEFNVTDILEDLLKYRNQNIRSLWDYLGEFRNVTYVKFFAERWESEKLYPVVKMVRNGDAIDISQEKFCYETFQINSTCGNDYSWKINLSFRLIDDDYASGYTKHELVTGWNYFHHTIPEIKSSHFHVGNTNLGYYLVNYDQHNWLAIQRFLYDKTYKVLTPLSRAQIVRDALLLARGGYLKYSIALDVIYYLAQETDTVPWLAAIDELKFLDSAMYGTEFHREFQTFCKHLIKKVYANVSIADPEVLQILTYPRQHRIMKAACYWGLTQCLNRSLEFLTDEWNPPNSVKNAKALPPNPLREIYLCTLIRHFPEYKNIYLYVITIHDDFDDPYHSLVAFRSLSCSQNSRRTIGSLKLFASKCFENYQFEVFIDHVLENTPQTMFIFENLLQMFNQKSGSLKNIPLEDKKILIEKATKGLFTQHELNEFNSFLRKNPHFDSPGIRINREIIESNLYWRNAYLKDVNDWLKNQKYDYVNNIVTHQT